MKLLILFALISVFTLTSAKTGMCAGFGDIHMVTPWGKYNNNNAGTLKFAKTKNFKINVEASKWSKGTTVATKVAIKAKGAKILFDGSHFTVNNVKCSFTTAKKNLSKSGVKLYKKKVGYGAGWRSKNAMFKSSGFILRAGKEFVEVMSLGNNKKKRGVYAGHYIAVNVQGNHSKYGMCGKKTVQGHLFNKRSTKIYHVHRYSKCSKYAHQKAELKCKNIKNYWRRKACVYDTCRGMSSKSAVLISYEIRKFQKYIAYWHKLKLHHRTKKVHFARLLKMGRARLSHYMKKASQHKRSAKINKSHGIKSTYHAKKSKKAYAHYFKLVKRYERHMKSLQASYRNHLRAYKHYAKLCVKYSYYSKRWMQYSLNDRKTSQKYTRFSSINAKTSRKFHVKARTHLAYAARYMKLSRHKTRVSHKFRKTSSKYHKTSNYYLRKSRRNAKLSHKYKKYANQYLAKSNKFRGFSIGNAKSYRRYRQLYGSYLNKSRKYASLSKRDVAFARRHRQNSINYSKISRKYSNYARDNRAASETFKRNSKMKAQTSKRYRQLSVRARIRRDCDKKTMKQIKRETVEMIKRLKEAAVKSNIHGRSYKIHMKKAAYYLKLASRYGKSSTNYSKIVSKLKKSNASHKSKTSYHNQKASVYEKLAIKGAKRVRRLHSQRAMVGVHKRTTHRKSKK